MTANPLIIQGGMGIGVSSWHLAREVSKLGQLGVVSGVVLDVVFARRLQDGDFDGNMWRALSYFPDQKIAENVFSRYFISGGKAKNVPYKNVPKYTINPAPELLELAVVSNFCEVWLAKEGHNGVVGINYLEKLQMANLPAIYGAVLAGVDYVCMGAGIPREIPGVLDLLANHESVSYRLNVDGASSDDNYRMVFEPKKVIKKRLPKSKRPKFLAIVSSSTLAQSLAKKSSGKVDGFIVEGSPAGGHNAPPRGELHLSELGEPIYGVKDQVDFARIKALGFPFWRAGGYSSPEGLKQSYDLGADGIQLGTYFAFCEESNLSEEIKQRVIDGILSGKVKVFTDPLASPTGFPFKVVKLQGTLSEQNIYEARPRMCDMGYLRHPYKKLDGSLGYRCPAEPIKAYVKKGGKVENAIGRKCLCNGLIANIGQPQVRKDGYIEPPIVTAGDDLVNISRFFRNNEDSYSAADVIEFLKGR